MARSTDDPKCIQHARFASHLDRAHFDFIYWALFVVVIFMLFAASWRYGRSIDDVANLTPGSPEHKRKMKRCMLICSIYATISVVAVVMEVYALMALQFCDGEDLMALYWSTWTVMQIGSLIAIFGVLLAVFHTIRGRKHPPWALALGTPVLVVAGLGHVVQVALHKKVKSVRGRNSISRDRLRALSEDRVTTAETLQAEDSEKDEPEYTYNAKLLGYTPDGATILQFEKPSSSPLNPLLSPSTQARIIGTNVDGQVIVALRDRKTSLSSAADDEVKLPAPAAPQARRSGLSIRVEEPLPRRTATPGAKAEHPSPRRTTAPMLPHSDATIMPRDPSPTEKKSPASVAVALARSDSSSGADGGDLSRTA